MDYLDTTDWDKEDPRAEALRDLLTLRFPDLAVLHMIIEGAGMARGDLPLGAPTIRALWEGVLADAAADRRLRKLTDSASAQANGGAAFERDLLDMVLTIEVTVAGSNLWYAHPDPFQSRFVGPGSLRPMVDRIDLRDALKRLEEKKRNALVVRGPRRSGKSHSWLLIAHVAKNEKSFVPTRMRVEQWRNNEVTALDVVESLAKKLGMTLDLPHEAADPNEQATATARKALDAFIGAYPHDGAARWIVLDGLDREEASECAVEFGLGLLEAVLDQEILDTCLIITGLDSFLPEDYQDLVDDESLKALSWTDIRQFLSTMATHTNHQIDGLDLDNMADEIFGDGMAEFSVMARTAAEKAIERFGQ